MPPRACFGIFLTLASLVGCGSGASNSSSQATTSGSSGTTQATYNFNGTWAATSTSNVAAYLPFKSISGALQVAGGSVTGSLFASTSTSPMYNTNICPAVNQSLTVTGTLDASQNLSLSFPIGGGTGTLLATLADDPQTLAYGAWQVAGGSCATSTTPMVIHQTVATTTITPVFVATSGNLSGNWAIGQDYVSNSQSANGVTGFGAALQISNGIVTGTVVPYPTFQSACYAALYTANPSAATGTLDAKNNLTITAPVAGGTATITATLGGDPETQADGSYQVVGGSCATAATPMLIAQFAPVTGTYKGTFNIPNQNTGVPIAGTDIAVTAVLSQSSTANASGGFPVTGTYTVTGACTASGMLAPSTVTGGGISAVSVPAGTAEILGSLDPSNSWIFDAYFSVNNCGSYQGNLIRQ